MKNIYHSFYGFLVICIGCTSVKTPEDFSEMIDADNIERHIKTLASDEYMGRRPGTIGESKTIQYIQDRFNDYGLKPINGGSFLQPFVINEIKPVPPQKMNVEIGSEQIEYLLKEDFIAKTNYRDDPVTIENKELVFIGFGIVAPEFDWDDYQGIDVKDKVVITLYSDPGLYDSTFFNGINATKYAYIEHKKKEAFSRGAAGLFTIFHDTGPTGMNWPLVQILATRSNHYLEGDLPEVSEELLFSGMLSVEMTKELLRKSGNKDDYIKNALSKNFKPVNLGAKISMTLSSELREFTTNNVIGMVKGSKRPEECVIYTAHWDHDGISENPVNGDSILNGAIDNASGTAMVIETARVFSELPKKPERSVLFFLTSAEEMGLLGAKYYANKPLLPIHKTVAVINTDASHATYPMRVAVNVLKGHTDLDSIVDASAITIGREIIPDPTPQIGAFQRSDHYPFVQKGVPGIWAVGGDDPLEGDSTEAMRLIYEYGSTKYHQVTDEYYEGFLMGNIRLDATFNLVVGHNIANSNIWPNWLEEGEYKVLRDSAMSIR